VGLHPVPGQGDQEWSGAICPGKIDSPFKSGYYRRSAKELVDEATEPLVSLHHLTSEAENSRLTSYTGVARTPSRHQIQG